MPWESGGSVIEPTCIDKQAADLSVSISYKKVKDIKC